jgi:uncharacterized membrane protein YeaQ/YmgE (transglycosylase-associated protein family)
MRSRPGIFWWTAVSALLMIVGGFGPWASVGAVTIKGTDGGDGWFLIVPGLLAGFLLFRQVTKPDARWPMILTAVLGAIGALVAVVDLSDINDLASETAFFGDLVDTGWGLYLSLVASLSLIAAAIATLVRRPYLVVATAMT